MKNHSVTGAAVCIALASFLSLTTQAQTQTQSNQQPTSQPAKPDKKKPARSSSANASGSQTVQPYQSKPIEPYHATEIKPHQATEIKPYQSTEIKPYHATEIKPYQSTEIKPHQATEIKPYQSTEVKAHQATESKPYQATEIKPVQSTPVRPNAPGYLPNHRSNGGQGRGVASLIGTFGLSVSGTAYVIDNYAANTRTQVTSAGALTNSSIRINPDHSYDWNSAWDGKLIHGRWVEQNGNIVVLHGQEGRDWVLRANDQPVGKATVNLWDQNGITYDGTPLR